VSQVDVEEIIRKSENLATLPGIAMEILAAVRNEKAGLNEIADILSKDPPLSAKVLRMINSPFYGLPRKVTSVPLAVNLLGINTVKNLALSFSLIRNYNQGNGSSFDHTLFWKNSLIAAVAAKLIGEQLLASGAEDVFFLGLLHNIGVFVLSQCLPEKYELVAKEVEAGSCTDHEAEKKIIGINHMQVGGFLVDKWGLPDNFSIPISYHHYPERLPEAAVEAEGYTKLLYLAALISDFLAQKNINYLKQLEETWVKYDLADKIRLDDIIEQIDKNTKDILPLFEIRVDKQENYLHLIEEARKELINLSSSIVTDLLKQEKIIATLKEQTLRDSLTGLFNYKGFRQFLKNEFYRAQRYRSKLALAIVDFDLFKAINDTFGHLAGDLVLRTVARHMTDCFRESDIIARYGGEEFAIIMPETDSTGAMIAVERLRQQLASLAIEFEGKSVQVSVSIGVASLEAEADITHDDLLDMADRALYQAKAEGRNRCCLYSTPK